MRAFSTICLLFLCVCLAIAQTTGGDGAPTAPVPGQVPTGGNLFTTVKPEATVRVRLHPTGADLVDVTLLDSQYPQEALRSQLERMGKELNSPPRGLMVFGYSFRPNDPAGTFVKATFATDGLADPNSGVYRLGPIARALAGGPAGHQIHGIAVIFENMAPGADTLQSWGLASGDPVAVEGKYEPGPIGLEYRILLRTQDPAKIDIPDRPTVNQPVPASKPAPAKDNPWGLYGLLVVSAIAIGALVYSLTLRRPSRRSSPASRYPRKGSSRHR